MFKIANDKTIHLTRGDIANICIGASSASGVEYTFNIGDVVRFRVMEKSHCDDILIQKDITQVETSNTITLSLTKDDTKIGDIINKPVDYWYEIELNPETNPQTLIGYDESGPKILRLYPEGSDL